MKEQTLTSGITEWSGTEGFLHFYPGRERTLGSMTFAVEKALKSGQPVT